MAMKRVWQAAQTRTVFLLGQPGPLRHLSYASNHSIFGQDDVGPALPGCEARIISVSGGRAEVVLAEMVSDPESCRICEKALPAMMTRDNLVTGQRGFSDFGFCHGFQRMD